MDVSLILTHRCNLACGYCYAGEHYRNEIDEDVLDRSVDLLFADDADTVQLSFFGGEPFLAFDSMRRAVALAEQRTAERGRRLLLQCTTNGSVLTDEHVAFVKEHDMRVTVSIDGVREAHDMTRPCTGGKSSFDQVHGGLRKLVDAGVRPDAMMVISPETAPFTYRSVGFLWSEGVTTVRANMVLDAPWTRQDRDELREELLAVGWEMLARRTRGENVSFEPFEKGMRKRQKRARRLAAGTAVGAAAMTAGRSQLVVGTRGHLYPCAPMVGADRDDGPEAALRIGHLNEGSSRIAERVECEGTKCGRGGGCECAAYLETGDRHTGGPNGRWYGSVCEELGVAIATALLANRYPHGAEQERPSRRPFLLGVAAAVSGLAIGVPALLKAGLFGGDEEPGCDLAVPDPNGGPPVPGEMAPPPEPIQPAGGITAPPEPEITVAGDMMPEPELVPEREYRTRGKMAMPPKPKPEEKTLGDFG
jgi:uncharacterized protein